MSKIDEIVNYHCRYCDRNSDPFDNRCKWDIKNQVAEIKQAVLEACGEDEDIREVISKPGMNYEGVSYFLGRNELRKEIKESIEKLFE